MATETLEEQDTSTGTESTITSDAGKSVEPPKESSSKSSWIKPDGTFDHTQMPEDLANDVSIVSRYKDVKNLAKAVAEGRRTIGKNLDHLLEIPVDPGEDASAEDRDKYEKTLSKWRKANGIPKTADGYKITPAEEEMPEGMVWDEGIDRSFRELAHKEGLTAGQAKALVNFHMEMQRNGMMAGEESLKNQIAENQATLQKEWAGNYKTNMKMAERGAKLLGADIKNFDYVLPEFTKAFAKAGQLLSEDTKVNGEMISIPEGKAWGMAVISGKDSSLHRLHELYQSGDPGVRRRVQQALSEK